MEAIPGACRGLPLAVFRQDDRLVLEIKPAERMFVLIDGTPEIVAELR